MTFFSFSELNKGMKLIVLYMKLTKSLTVSKSKARNKINFPKIYNLNIFSNKTI